MSVGACVCTLHASKELTSVWNFFLFLVQALLAARNSAATVFIGTFGALAYVILLMHGDLDVLCIFNFLLLKFLTGLWCAR